MSPARILAIDDEHYIRQLIQNEFSEEGFEVSTAGSGEEGLKMVVKEHFDVVLLDIKLPRMDGIETLKRLKEKTPATAVIMITGFGDIKTAIDSMKLGAFDYVTKPFKLEELLKLTKAAASSTDETSVYFDASSDSNRADGDRFVHCPSGKMQDVYDLSRRIAPTGETVLIRGETGVGKDILAMQIHQWSQVKSGPFLTVDCGLLADNLAESELYGHRKGAFSGANESKTGLVERADGGTLFLDEIGNIGLEMQKKFLRFLETKRFRRVGETRESQVQTRIILATNLDLEEAVETGKLRSDLFYRISSFTIHIPPLRERPADVIPLAKHFLATTSPKGKTMPISPDAQQVLRKYCWPGNIRELRSVVNKARILVKGTAIEPDDLPSGLHRSQAICDTRPKTLEDMEKAHIMAVLEETGGNQSQAATILGINRKTLYKKIKKHQIFD